MTYPYGMKGAPVVGNGLGGLPRRAVATAAVVATGPRQLVRVGTPFTTFINGGDVSNIGFSVIKSRNQFVWYRLRYSQFGSTWNEFRRATLAGDSVTVNEAFYQSASDSPNLGYGNSDFDSTGVLFTFGEMNNQTLYRYTPSRQLVSDAVATSGTVTHGLYAGSSWSRTTNEFNFEDGSAESQRGSGFFFRVLSNDTGLIIRGATLNGNSSQRGLLAQTINLSTGATINAIQLFVTGSPSTHNIFAYYIRRLNGDNFSIFCAAGLSDPSASAFATTFNPVAGTVGTVRSTTGMSSGGTSFNGGGVIQSGPGTITMRAAWFQVLTINFPIDSSGVPSATPTSSVADGFGSDQAGGRYVDREFGDVFGARIGGTILPASQYDAPVSGSSTNLRTSTAIVGLQNYAVTNDLTLETGTVGALVPKALITYDAGDDQGAWGPPFASPVGVIGRPSEFSLLCGVIDRNNSVSGTRFYLQMFRAI